MGRAGTRWRNLIFAAAVVAALAAPLGAASCAGNESSASGEAGGGASPRNDAGSGGHDAGGGDAGDAGAHHDAGGHHDASDDRDAALSDADAACNTMEMGYPLQPGIHVPICSYIEWPTNPPTSGEHYPIWSAYKAYDKPVPRGFSVHDLEHGGVVIAYNCPGGCDADVAALEAWLAARPADPTCTPPVHARITVTPDPLLDVRFAAAAWGFSLKSDCFDLDALGPFIDAHYRMAPEDFCDDGIDPTSPDAGLPADCGDPPDSGAPDGS